MQPVHIFFTDLTTDIMIVLHITSVQQVDRLGTSKYGMIKFARREFIVTDLVEKPGIHEASFGLAVGGKRKAYS
ncbi:hypothetical protein [Bacillus pumilus]|jgi:UTP-glucose-1-phosphate uridylyltransferase|uniref:hypothetical protein n=1 Tax=Bacillus pumilus TaxID=1408 RepID=UPI00076132AF|nr:hypothetical protein [Bacillus pumilus]AOC56539.1 hypothetical protein BEN31_06920 [Bacillus pumilus]